MRYCTISGSFKPEVADVTENPKNLKIVAVDAACLKLPAFDKARPENQPDAE